MPSSRYVLRPSLPRACCGGKRERERERERDVRMRGANVGSQTQSKSVCSSRDEPERPGYVGPCHVAFGVFQWAAQSIKRTESRFACDRRGNWRRSTKTTRAFHADTRGKGGCCLLSPDAASLLQDAESGKSPHPLKMLTCFSLADKTPRLPHHRRRDREARDAARSIQGPWSRGDGHRAQDGHPLHELRVVQAAARAQGRHRLWASNIYRYLHSSLLPRTKPRADPTPFSQPASPPASPKPSPS